MPASELVGELDEGLAQLGYDAFRPGQREAITALFEHKRLLLVAPTGQGKSLTYQLPGCLLPGTTLVISPLIALMQDQVSALQQRGVAATFLASTLDGQEARARMAGIARGEYKLVYVAPERLAFGGFRGLLSQIECPLLVVDEAHCISEWGHDFRPEYLQIGDVIRALGSVMVMACTATATPVVRDEILSRLGLGADTPQHLRGFARPNLTLRAREGLRKREAQALVDDQLAQALGGPQQPCGAAIVYAPTRRRTEQEAARISALGYACEAYHAGLTAPTRARVQERFMDGRLAVVVATNAFGMGIDRADVRAVIHLAPPGSIEAYYQEVGRAGRDGGAAFGLLLSSSQDMPLRRRLLEAPLDDQLPDPAVVEHKWSLFMELMRWVEGGSCRHDAILRYFGDEEETLDGCGRCDVCEGLGDAGVAQDAVEAALLVRKALSGVARVHGKFGLRMAALLLRGVADPKLSRAGLDQVKTFGAMAEWSDAWIQQLLRRCVTAGFVAFSADERPVVSLTDEGLRVMRAEREPRLLLPPQAPRAARGGLTRPSQSGTAAGPAVGELALDADSETLFAALRAYRLELAKEQGVPPYVIASDRTLRDMALLKPRTYADLLAVHGIGPTKAERYGEGLLAVVNA